MWNTLYLSTDLTDCRIYFFTTNSNSFAAENRYDYDEQQLCSNCQSSLGTTATRQEEADKEEEEKIAMNYLLRLMTASSKLANTLKRREYRT